MQTNDEITWSVEKRTIKVFRGSKHVKSVPKIYEPVMDLASFNFEAKRLQEEEKKELNKILFPIIKSSFEDRLKEKEKYVFELIQGAEFKGVRIVKIFKRNQRLEAVYIQNNIERALEIEKDFFNICPEKLPIKHCNY